MKTHITLGSIAVAATLLAGCCSLHPTGSAYGHEQEFRQKLETTVPLQKWGFKVEEIRFSDDRQKALVVFETSTGKRQEAVFTEDSFHRYVGKVWDYNKMDASGGLPINGYEIVVVEYPSR